MVGLGSVLSFNQWSGWHPLGFLPIFEHKTFFDVMDYACSNVLMPIGALLTSVLVGWRLGTAFSGEELIETTPRARVTCLWLLRYVCPLAILAVFAAALT
jgi:NSS family neurotransmitter:Na+ symporter